MRLLSCATLLAALALPAEAQAQTRDNDGARVEAIVTLGWGRLWQWESSQRFRGGINVGAALIIRGDSGLAVSLGADRTLGLTAAPMTFSANARYYFRSDERVQPYVIAGLGLLRLSRRGVPLTVGRARATDVGFGPNLGAGVAITNDSLAIVVPEVQWLEGSWRSPLNMSITRITGGIGSRFSIR